MQAGHRHTDQLPQVLSTGGGGATPKLSQENVFNDVSGDQLTDPEYLMNGFGETFYHFYEFYQFYGFYGFYMEEHSEMPDLPMALDQDFSFYDAFYEYAPQELETEQAVMQLCMIAISPAVGPESGGTAVTLQLAGQVFPGHTEFYCKFGSQVEFLYFPCIPFSPVTLQPNEPLTLIAHPPAGYSSGASLYAARVPVAGHRVCDATHVGPRWSRGGGAAVH